MKVGVQYFLSVFCHASMYFWCARWRFTRISIFRVVYGQGCGKCCIAYMVGHWYLANQEKGYVFLGVQYSLLTRNRMRIVLAQLSVERRHSCA